MLDKPVVQAFITQAHKRSYPAKHTLIHTGDVPQTLYLLLEGSVTIQLEDEQGREIVLAYLGAGCFFGELCLFPEQQSRTAIVRTKTPVLVAEIGYENFRQFNQKHPEIMFELAGQLAERLRDTSRRLSDLAFLDVSGRIARALLDLCRRPEAVLSARGTAVRISRQELARNVGCSREMAGRVLKKLEEDGVISSKGRSILVYSERQGEAPLLA